MSIAIVETLKTILGLSKEKSNFEQQIDACLAKINLLQKDAGAIAGDLRLRQEDLAKKRKEIDRLELEVEVLNQQEKSLREKMQDSSRSRECEALVHELQSINVARAKVEDVMVRQWDFLNDIKADIEEEKEHIAILSARHELVIQAEKDVLSKLQAEIMPLEDMMAKSIQQLPLAMQAQFQAVHNAAGEHLAAVVSGMCAGCYYPIPNVEMSRLKTEMVGQCQNCYRVLFVEDEHVDEIKPLDIKMTTAKVDKPPVAPKKKIIKGVKPKVVSRKKKISDE